MLAPAGLVPIDHSSAAGPSTVTGSVRYDLIYRIFLGFSDICFVLRPGELPSAAETAQGIVSPFLPLHARAQNRSLAQAVKISNRLYARAEVPGPTRLLVQRASAVLAGIQCVIRDLGPEPVGTQARLEV